MFAEIQPLKGKQTGKTWVSLHNQNFVELLSDDIETNIFNIFKIALTLDVVEISDFRPSFDLILTLIRTVVTHLFLFIQILLKLMRLS